jgi:uncharacterized protein (TIGR03085 family)
VRLQSGNVAEASFDALERQQLCDLFVELGPDAPTLIEPWSTRDLAAHLVLREHDSVAAPGLVLPGPWHRFAVRRTAELAERDFASLVNQVRSGPPGVFRIGWVRRFPNLNEFFVHHEDARRANDRGPRNNTPDLDAALWRNVALAPWFLARRLHGVGLELEWAGTKERVRARRGKPTARLVGLPGELLLYLFGRQAVAQVEVAGDPAAVAAVRETSFGM